MYTYAQDADAGITISPECIWNGTCKLNAYKTLQIRDESDRYNKPVDFVQDIFLWATFFIGTMTTIWLIISWMMMVFWWADEGMYEKGKQGMKYSIIGLLLVILSYTIIRATQYIAQGS